MRVLHMSGAGNDFMVMDARGLAPDFSALALEYCAKTHADGFMAVDYSDKADFKLHFYNSDGSRGEMCGNGARCICRFAYDQGIAPAQMTVQTDAGIVYGWRLSESQYRIRLNEPGVLDLCRKENVAYLELGNPGVPHAVLEIPGLDWEKREPLRSMAKALRYDPAFPKGANVNLYTWLEPGAIRVLTYERGVEDYTLACGTGCASTTVVLWLKGLVPDGKLRVEVPGGTLFVTITGENGAVTELTLEGPTEVVRTYEL